MTPRLGLRQPLNCRHNKKKATTIFTIFIFIYLFSIKAFSGIYSLYIFCVSPDSWAKYFDTESERHHVYPKTGFVQKNLILYQKNRIFYHSQRRQVLIKQMGPCLQINLLCVILSITSQIAININNKKNRQPRGPFGQMYI